MCWYFQMYTVLLCTLQLSLQTFARMSFTWDSLEAAAGKKININKLLSLHEAICPSKTTCSRPTNIADDLGKFTCFSDPCSCSYQCHDHNDCCPTKPHGYLKTNCKAATFLKANEHEHKELRRVDECLNKSHPYAERCKSEPINVLVVSPETGLLYENEYCAKCNGVKTVTALDARLACSPFDGVSITDKFRNGECEFVYFEDNEHKSKISMYSCVSDTADRAKKEVTVKSCNESGLWTQYDADIAWACEHLIQAFGIFKNVFCYICNPSLATFVRPVPLDKQLSVCPVESKLEEQCERKPSVERLLPFKNIYCRLCFNESNNSDIFGESRIHHLESGLSKSFILIIPVDVVFNENYDVQFDKYFQIIDIMYTTLNADMAMALKSQLISDGLKFHDVTQVTQALSKMCESTRGNCDIITDSGATFWPSWAREGCVPCNCDDHCAYKGHTDYDCCLDKQINTRTYTCFSPPIIFNGDQQLDDTTFKVISSCPPDFNDTYIINNCMVNSTLQVPVEIDGKTFKNPYCFLCNMSPTSSKTMNVFIMFSCKTYIEPEYIALSEMILSLAKEQNCTVQFSLPPSAQKCFQETEYIANLNATIVGNLNAYEQFVHICFMDGKWVYREDLKDTRVNQTNLIFLPHYSELATYKQICKGAYVNALYVSAIPVASFNSHSLFEPILCGVMPGYSLRNTYILPTLKQCVKTRQEIPVKINYRTLFSLSLDELNYLGSTKEDIDTCQEESYDIVKVRC